MEGGRLVRKIAEKEEQKTDGKKEERMKEGARKGDKKNAVGKGNESRTSLRKDI